MDPPLPPQTVVKMEPPTTEDKAKDQSPPDATKVESQIENPEVSDADDRAWRRAHMIELFSAIYYLVLVAFIPTHFWFYDNIMAAAIISALHLLVTVSIMSERYRIFQAFFVIFQIAFKFYCIATFPLLIMSTLSSSPDCEPQMHICINELGEIALYVQMIVITVIHFLMFLFCLVEVKRCLILLEYIGPKDDYSMDPCESYYSEYEASNNASPTKQDLPQIVIAA
ncbi:hypothetical protein L3Y34_011856 [Caenorhabditis briggsae]|uniref:Transmembrane protein n=1 Tax=Caenorhabditis briggsae TaxID=6238 RepID=A0AAE8ZPW7_CAEBR|nr:hypothetical protein L3Y34_011856 [Caenorhabditis briggsae]